jgi:hypothetical protein
LALSLLPMDLRRLLLLRGRHRRCSRCVLH